jgi:alkanesulfonate monooxygenase SsuD/methylene tetrahydromethanopterin reductase-like flavin-dependent oxidoreductase (luciferase family)
VKFGLVVVPEHPAAAPMVRMLDEAMGQTRAARDHGFDTVSVGHHYLTTPFQYVQPIPTLARLAAEAGAMTLATTVLLIALMHPVDLAEQVATLDNLTGGRLVFGVGLGYRDEEFAAFGVPRGGRVARFEENLRLVRRLWTEPAVTYAGPGWELREARVSIRPAQRPHPPIWMAANADGAVRRAARLADTWLVNNHASLGTLERQMGVYRDELARCGRPFPAELPIIKELCVAEDAETAWRDAGPSLAAKYRSFTEWGQDRALPAGERFVGSLRELARDRFIVGDPATCADEIRRYHARLGVTHFIFRVQWPGTPQAVALRTIRLFAERVRPMLSASGEDSHA